MDSKPHRSGIDADEESSINSIRTSFYISASFGQDVLSFSCINDRCMRKTGPESGMGLSASARVWLSTWILRTAKDLFLFLSSPCWKMN